MAVPGNARTENVSLEVLFFKIDALQNDVRSLSKKVDWLVEKANNVDIWKERIEGRLAAGTDKMEALGAGAVAIEKKTEAELCTLKADCKTCKSAVEQAIADATVDCEEKYNALRAELEENYISKRVVLYIAIGAAVAGGGGVLATLKAFF